MELLTEMEDLRGLNLLHEGSIALMDVEHVGMGIDVEYCLKKTKQLKKEIQELKKKCDKDTKVVKPWKKKYKGKFNIQSSTQLSDILFNELGHKAVDLTDAENPATTEAALSKLKLDVLTDIINIKRKTKLKNTYLGNFLREEVDGRIHSFLGLHTTATYRGSSRNPNIHNIPVRLPETKKTTREAVVPKDKDHGIMEIDFSGVEVMTATCYHKDPNMIEEILNPERDMHNDAAKDCFILSDKEVTKILRFYGKNMFIFPQFYGDYYVSCATSLWEAIKAHSLKTAKGLPLRKHLKKKGIKTYKQFEKHIKKVEKKFWTIRFPIYGKWKENHVKIYQEKGYYDSFTGFRYQRLMSRNDIINYPIQGDAFHILLLSLIHVNKEFKARGLKSRIINHIHDALLIEYYKKEYNEVIAICKQIMEEEVRKVWKWIIIPLTVEVEVSPLGKSWYYKQEVNESKCKKCNAEWRYVKKSEDGKSLKMECPICRKKTKKTLH